MREALLAAGFRPDEIERRLALFREVEAAFAEAVGGHDKVLVYHVPGRIEVFGKHTDYAGGRSLVCATEQGFALLAAPRTDGRLTLLDARAGARRGLEIGPDLEAPVGDWANYPITVARRLARDFGPGLRGADLVFASDLPIAAGVSSSSALVVAVALVLRDVNRLADTGLYRANIGSAVDLGGYLGAVENGRPFRALEGSGGVGTMGGSQDQTAILISRPDALAQIRFLPVELEGIVPLPPDLTFVVAASGIEAEKTGAALAHYNGLATLTRTLDELVLAATDGALSLGAALLDQGPGLSLVLDRLATLPPERAARLRDRLTQLASECRYIIPGIVSALERRDFARVAELTRASQAGAELALENQVPETIALVEEAHRLGAVAASAFGAGFGGSVWALTRVDEADRLAGELRAGYLARFPERAAGCRVFRTRPAPPGLRLEAGTFVVAA